MTCLGSIRSLKQSVLPMVLTVVLLSLGSASAKADPVKIESGLISGMKLGEDKEVSVYKGIPYAAPPVGDLRWRPPQPVAPWEGVRACNEFAAACPQTDRLRVYGLELPEMSEDCLYLNVWTAGASSACLPVMVWIHGGGYMNGWGHQPSYDGEAFARKGIVLVTINYRLGPFGFFGHPLLSAESDHDSSGNYGMLDQIAALRWVQRNIAAFGGDPGAVTIFGESAGGGSVSFLCLSPLSKGLFHRAICQSGSIIWSTTHLRRPSPLGESVEAMGQRLAGMLVGQETDDLLKALRAVPAEELLSKTNPGLDAFSRRDSNRFGPAVDGWVMPDYPAILYEKGLQHDIPLMAGTNADEGTIFALMAPYKTVEDYREAIRQFWQENAGKILETYPVETAGQIPTATSTYIADTWFVAPTRAMVRAMSGVKSNAYLYQFTRKQQTGRLRTFGAFHGSEIPYVFNSSSPIGPKEEEVLETDRKLADAMIEYWAQFAKTGDPNGSGLPEWPVYDAASDQHLELGDTIQVGSGLRKEACDVLDSIVAARLRDLKGPK